MLCHTKKQESWECYKWTGTNEGYDILLSETKFTNLKILGINLNLGGKPTKRELIVRPYRAGLLLVPVGYYLIFRKGEFLHICDEESFNKIYVLEDSEIKTGGNSESSSNK